MSLPRAIIFGASQSGILFYHQYNADYCFVGFCDNDALKHGTMLEGLPVFGPTDLGQQSFDQIIISSFWSAAIKAQLINELGIPSSQLYIPRKHLIASGKQPLLDPAFRRECLNLIQFITDFFERHEVQLFIDFGTLLGVVRDQDLIPWDMDIDLSLSSEQAMTAAAEIPALTAALQDTFTGDWSVSQTVQDDGSVSQIKLLYNTDKLQLPISLLIRQERDGQSVVVASNGFFQAPAKYFQSREPLHCGEFTFWAPQSCQNYLTHVYGDWEKPNPAFSTADYKNTGQCITLTSSETEQSFQHE